MAITTYQNFDLLITRSGDDYRAFVVDAPGGDADSVFALPFTADELDFLGNLAGVRRGGSGGSAAGSASDLKELGGLLYGAVIQGKVAAVLAASLEKSEQENVGLRLRLRFSEETSELATLPWEILYDPVQERFLALSESSPILRYLSLPKARPTLLVKPPLRVLTVLASPPGYEELDLEREWQVLETALADLVADGKFVLERLESPTFSALQQRLLGDDIHILHFVGHGVYDEAVGAGALVLADSEGNSQEISGEELATLLHNHRSLRLVYLNACEGALSSHLNVFSGVAQTLVQQGVPAAVAMQAEISDNAAIDLSRIFYSALAAGYPVDAALTQARLAIVRHSAEWAIPVLFSRSPDNRLFDVVEVLPAPDCPYPGMVPFTEKQADVFFGRDKEIADAIERLRQHPFLTVIGPSGSGKSSLVYAGVIPALRQSKRFGAGEWDVRILRPGAKPLTALAATLGIIVETQNLASLQTNRTLLFVDQFEETFTLAEAGQAQQFLDALNALISKPNLYILLTVRADFYPDLMACSLWQPIRANRLELTPLGDEELRAAILQPAAQVGVTIDGVLAERLVGDAAGESGALPLVQETLVLLWEKVERRHLALQAYSEMAEGNRNGLQVAIDRRATTVYNNLPEDAQPIARRIFLRLVQFGEGRLDTRRQQTVDELRASGDDPALFDRTLARLTENRLLTTSGEEGSGRRVDIAHETLIGGWALLRQWIGERRSAEQTRRRLEEKASEWIDSEKQGGLLNAFDLQEAEAWRGSPDATELGVSHGLLSLVSESKAALELQARTKQRNQILALAAGLVIVGLIIGTLLVNNRGQQKLLATQATAAAQAKRDAEELSIRATAVATAKSAAEANAAEALRQEATAVAAAELAQERQQNAEQNAREALASKYAAQSLSILIGYDTTTAMARALDGVLATLPEDGYIVPDADSALRRATGLYAFRSTLPYFRHVAGINAVALSPDGSTIASSSDDRGTRIWDAASHRHLYFFGNLDGSAETVAFSPDGTFLVAAGQDPKIHVWDLASKNLVYGLEGHRGSVRHIAFSHDGTRMLSASEDHTVIVWQTSDWTQKLTLTDHGSVVMAVAFNGDDTRIVSVAEDGRLRFWDAHTGELLNAISASGTTLRSVAFRPDGKQVITGGDENVISIWDAESGEAIATLTGHERPVYALAVSRDGRLLASASADSTVKLWNLETFRLVDTYRGDEKEHKSFTSVIFSADESTLISGGDDLAIRLWNIANLEDISSFPGHVDAVLSAAFSPDSTEIVTVGQDQQIRFWSVTSGSTTNLLQTHAGSLNTVAYSPDSQHIATAGESGLIQIWNTESGKNTLTLAGHTGAVAAIAYGSDGERIISGGQDGTLRFWNTRTGEEQVQIEVAGVGLRAVAFDPSGQKAASAGDDGIIRLWDAQIGQLLAEWEGHEGVVYAIAFSRDGRMLVSAGEDKTVRVWSVDNGVPLRLFQGHSDRVRAVAFSPDGRRVASGSDDRTVRLWDVERGEAIRVLFGHSDIIRSLAFSPDGDTLVSTAGGTRGNNSIRLWAVKPLAERLKLEPHGGLLRWATISPDGLWIATACDDGQVRIWDGESGALVKVINAHGIRVRTVAFAHDSRRLVSAGDDNTIRIWEVGSWRRLAELSGHQAWVRSAFFSPDDSTIVSASEDKSVRLWDATTGLELHQMTGHEGVAVFATFSPDGKLIASAGFDRTVRLWSADTGELLRTLQSPSHFNNIVAFSPDGSILAAGTGDADNVNQVYFWQVATGEEAREPLLHTGPVRGIAFSPDGKWLLTAGHGNPVQLWDMKKSVPFRSFTEHNKAVWSVNFSADGDYFITASEDGTARLWLTTIEEQIGLAQALLARDPPIFTPETRSHLINYGE